MIVSHIIVLFDFIEERHEHGAPLQEALLDAGILRLRPVLITVAATVIALFPLAAHGGPLWEPLCYAQIGGLTFATFVTLLLVPVIYATFVLDLKLVRWDAHEPKAIEPSSGRGCRAGLTERDVRAAAERHRLAEDAAGKDGLAALGHVRQRPRVGNRAGGLQRRRQRLGLLPPRPRPQPRLPLERGRPRRLLRSRSASVSCGGVVERARPDPEGAAVRPLEPRGQPRRGRQGVLLLSRQHADAYATRGCSTSIRRLPFRMASSSTRTGAAARTIPSTSCSTPSKRRSENGGTSTSSSSTRSGTPRTFSAAFAP